jgi:hypothetical protein
MTNLPDKITKALRGECDECTSPAHEDTGLCLHHHGKAATRQRRRRQRLADAGFCRDGCGRKVQKKHRPDRTVVPRRCSTCARASHLQIQEQRERRRDNESAVGVTDEEKIPAKRGRIYIEEREGLQSIARYVGRDRKGAPSREELDEELKHDLTSALTELQAVRDQGIALLRSERVTELGRAAKKEAAVELADRVLRVSRICRAAADNLSPGRAAEIEAMASDAVDDE